MLLSLASTNFAHAKGSFFSAFGDTASDLFGRVLPNVLPAREGQCVLGAFGSGLPNQGNTIQAAQDNLVGPYGQCFMSLANKHDISIDKETGSQDILNSTCSCQRPKFSDDREVSSEADSAMKKAQEEVLSSQIRGTLLGQFNNLLFLSELISEGSSNASITALAPNCRIGKIFDSLEALSKRDDCKGKGDVFNRRFEQIFGSSVTQASKMWQANFVFEYKRSRDGHNTILQS